MCSPDMLEIRLNSRTHVFFLFGSVGEQEQFDRSTRDDSVIIFKRGQTLSIEPDGWIELAVQFFLC